MYLPRMGVGWGGEETDFLGLSHRSSGSHILSRAFCNGGLELSVPLLYLWRVERSWRLNQSPVGSDLIKYACLMKPPQNPEGWSLESFWVGEHVEVLGEWSSQREDVSSVPLPHILSMHLSHQDIHLSLFSYPFILSLNTMISESQFSFCYTIIFWESLFPICPFILGGPDLVKENTTLTISPFSSRWCKCHTCWDQKNKINLKEVVGISSNIKRSNSVTVLHWQTLLKKS